MYEIEKDVPIPLTTREKARIYPFSQMEIGDSFFVPGNGIKLDKIQRKIHTTLRYRKDLPKGYKIRCHQQKKEAGVRCWRVK